MNNSLKRVLIRLMILVILVAATNAISTLPTFAGPCEKCVVVTSGGNAYFGCLLGANDGGSFCETDSSGLACYEIFACSTGPGPFI